MMSLSRILVATCLLVGLLGGLRTHAADAPHDLSAAVDSTAQLFLEHHGVPGAAVAITRHGQVVYAAGYGLADVEQEQPVTSQSLFRIASVSKPITAVAILHLAEQQQLRLNDRVFDLLQYEPFLEDGQSVDDRHRDITIEHLLQHRGGWDREVSFDAMFQSVRFAELLGTEPPAGPDAIIRVMLGKPLDFTPGDRYAYSNYGYCLLGRVIEQITKEPYEQAVVERVLKPMGIHRMRIGRTRQDERHADEVAYYHPGAGYSVFAKDLNLEVPHPYGAWYLEAMDAHGGWIASAEDLARFTMAWDHPQRCPVLSAESIDQMFRRPPGLAGHRQDGQPKNRYYALGWSVSVAGDRWQSVAHTGSLPGTSTHIERRSTGTNIVVLMNSRLSVDENAAGQSLAKMLTDELYRAIEAIKR